MQLPERSANGGAMLPLAWFYIFLVAISWALLFYLEIRKRAQQHVKGCPSLPYISAERLDSLIAFEPDLVIVELSCQSRERPHIPDALRISIDELDTFLREAPHRAVFVFYDSATEPAQWRLVESIVNHYTIPYVSVLKGGVESWLSKQKVGGFAVAS
jgi:hypothetical protein